jgi:hypothetical protein
MDKSAIENEIESIEIDISILDSDYERLEKERVQTVKNILGKKHNGKLSVKECMTGLFGELTDDDFEKYYQLYALGFQTGRLLGYTNKRRTLESNIRSLKRLVR